MRPDENPREWRVVRRLSPALVLGCALSGCYSAGDGIEPPHGRAYFPVGLAITQGAAHLVVANSDFDLQYNAGTLSVLDLDRVRAFVPKPCEDDAGCSAEERCDREPTSENGGVPAWVCVDSDGPEAGKPCGLVAERRVQDQLVYPGRCESIDWVRPPEGEALLTDSVEIGAFCTDVVYRGRGPTQPAGPAGRLFVPVRGDATLHWVDVDGEGQLDCGQAFNRGACDDHHRAGNDPEEENTRDLRLDAEPFAVDATPDGEAVLVSNQTTGRVSLFVNDWSSRGPRLEFVVTNLPSRPVGVAALPPPALSLAGSLDYAPGFLVTFRNAAQVRLIRYYSDSVSEPERPYATNTGVVGVTINSLGTDSRGIAVDATERRAAESECADRQGLDPGCAGDPSCVGALSDEDRRLYLGCLSQAAAVPLSVFVANRTPASLLVGHTIPAVNAISSTELPAFQESVPLTLGPSRVVTGEVIVGEDASGAPVYEPRVFAVCFDSRRVFIFDPIRVRVEAEIATGRGPHALAVDREHGLLYVAHFTDSYIGVVSIDRRFPRTYARTLASIGKASAPRASK